VTPAELLSEALGSPADSIDRALFVTAAVSLATGATFILVGGSAVNVHTNRYLPTDIDLIGPFGAREQQRLLEIGFVPKGRHFSFGPENDEILIEFPDSVLFGLARSEPQEIEVAAGIVATLIALDDLMMDRVLQATDGTVVTFEEAVRLAVGTYPRIDWDSLRQRCEEASAGGGTAAVLLPETLRRIRWKARGLLRGSNRQ
jgi:hypothetical protein